MEENEVSVSVESLDSGSRLDRFVSSAAGISRNRAQQLIRGGLVTVDGTTADKNHLLVTGETITWKVVPRQQEKVVGESIDLEVLYEDSCLAVIDKPAGMVMYPGPGHREGTLLNALIHRYPQISQVGGSGRQGIFHRLDRDTSGLVAVALSEEAFESMAEKIKERQVRRLYTALVSGDIAADRGTIDAPMGRSRGNRKKMAVDRVSGRRAVSHFEVIERFSQGFDLVEVTLETGRTHQIRVHFSHIGHPVAGDRDYSGARAGKKIGLNRQFLHAFQLSFNHPVSNKPLSFQSEIPEDLAQVLSRLRSG